MAAGDGAALGPNTWVSIGRPAKLTRFQGEVRITFDQPQRVKLSPADWTDTFLSRARCRNVMVDLLDGTGPAVLRGEKVVRYQVGP